MEDKCFCEGDFTLHLFRAKVAVAAALVFVSALTAGLSQPAGKLSITVTGVRNSDGVVRCALFNSPAAFPKIAPSLTDSARIQMNVVRAGVNYHF
jgi:uncharacterized protein (DUF2141 family)